MANISPFQGLSRSNQIHQRVGAYGQLAIDLTEEGWLPYLRVLKFRHLRGRRSAVLHQMHREATRAYEWVLTRVWRKPYSAAYGNRLPRWILAPDYPVWKHAKVSARADAPNCGLHLQGVAVMPPSCRLHEGLNDHLRRDHERYCRPGSPLISISATPIVSDLPYAHEYNFKAVLRGQADFDEALILPPAASERSARSKRAHDPWKPLVHEVA